MSGVMFQLAVAGAHLSGLPLNHQLTSLGATLVRTVRTAPVYSEWSVLLLWSAGVGAGKARGPWRCRTLSACLQPANPSHSGRLSVSVRC